MFKSVHHLEIKFIVERIKNIKLKNCDKNKKDMHFKGDAYVLQTISETAYRLVTSLCIVLITRCSITVQYSSNLG
jgi:hypothetical protein